MSGEVGSGALPVIGPQAAKIGSRVAARALRAPTVCRRLVKTTRKCRRCEVIQLALSEYVRNGDRVSVDPRRAMRGRPTMKIGRAATGRAAIRSGADTVEGSAGAFRERLMIQ